MEGGLTGAVIFLTVGIITFIYGIYRIIQYRKLCKYGIKIKGVVTWKKNGPLPISLPTPHVKFETANGQIIQKIPNVNSQRFRKKEGEVVSLVYNPKTETQFFIVDVPPFLIAIALFLFSITAFCASFVWFYTNIKN